MRMLAHVGLGGMTFAVILSAQGADEVTCASHSDVAPRCSVSSVSSIGSPAASKTQITAFFRPGAAKTAHRLCYVRTRDIHFLRKGVLTLYIILAILMFGVLIAVHEFGHFIAAKACGVRVEEFADRKSVV